MGHERRLVPARLRPRTAGHHGRGTPARREHGDVGALLALQRAAGNGAVSELLASRRPVVQRLIWLPFDLIDSNLDGFARNEASKRYAEPVQLGGRPSQVAVDEDILIVAHGNGVSMSNLQDATDDE